MGLASATKYNLLRMRELDVPFLVVVKQKVNYLMFWTFFDTYNNNKKAQHRSWHEAKCNML